MRKSLENIMSQGGLDKISFNLIWSSAMNTSSEKILLTTRQFILYLVDIQNFAFQIFDARRLYEKPIEKYFGWRDLDKERFKSIIKRLKKRKIIEVYLKDSQEMIRLTGLGKAQIPFYLLKEMQSVVSRADWDGKWRIVVFDISNDKGKTRDIFRRQLMQIGFFQLQESVFVFPYDCTEEIRYLREILNLKPNVKYIVADSIESETDLVSEFIDRGIIPDSLRSKKRQ